MNINNEFFGLLQEQNILKTTKTKPLVDAIQNRHPITFMYNGPRKPYNKSVKAGKRVKAEAVALGLSRKGNLIIRAFVQPPSTSKTGFNKHGWRTFMVSRMSAIQIFDQETFDNTRPGYKDGEESKAGPMQVTYVTSDWTKKPEDGQIKQVKVKKEPKPEAPRAVTQPTPDKETDVLPTDLPKIDQKTKPDPIQKDEPIEPTQNEPETKLPPIKQDEKPSINPEDDINKNLQEEVKKMKSLISFQF